MKYLLIIRIRFGDINNSYEEIMVDRQKAKKWFNEQKKYWGRGCSRVINLWIKENQEEVNKFHEDFDKKIAQYMKIYGKIK